MSEKQDWDAENLGGSWKRGIVNPELEEERKKCTFDQDELFRFIYTEQNYKLIKKLDELCKKNPELTENQMDIYEMTREQAFEHNWKRIHRLMQLMPELFTENDSMQSFKWSFAFNSVISPIHMH